MENPIEPAAMAHGAGRFRYLIDIVILVAVVFGLETAAEAIYKPKSMESGFVFGGAIQMLEVLVACVLIWLRRERLADIGLKHPKNWPRTLLIGILLAAVVFTGIYFSEKAGFHRDLSRFSALQGNLGLTIYTVVYVLIGAGFYEEFMFRGFLMQGLAMLFGGNRGAWITACIIQGLLFGASHAYQNPLGMLITGTLGVLLAVLVFVSGRNLWPAIIAHGLFDASRAVLFYFQGPPAG
ncbi:MAG TPA: type II CAAX endopeptidase family protein [Chthoniobacterales bacterium]|jgi:membrane protease YdiL (CAAX protease family)|nr:type II CAAX endopeptidase family protein [Chthoniobacterales bacterium]